MDRNRIRYHPEYGEPLQTFKMGPLPIKPLIFISLFLVIGIYSFFKKLPELDNFEGIVASIFLWGLCILAAKQAMLDRNQICFVIYENGLWHYKKILGAQSHFIPWQDIDYFEKQSLTKQFKTLYVVIHIKDKARYDSNIPFYQRLAHLPVNNSYQYIATVNYSFLFGESRLIDIDHDRLFYYLNSTLRNWRNSQKEAE